MRILIIENDFDRKHKIWKLLCMATQNDLEMDFERGTVGEEDTEEFQSISINLNNNKDVYGLQGFLHYWMEHEVTPKGEDDDDLHS